jgi:glucan phosphorylase
MYEDMFVHGFFMIDVTADHPVAYFCSEFALESGIPIYAGGLGVLAGDTLRQASDEQFSMIGVGLLYQGGRAKQRVDTTGWQVEEDMVFDPVASGFERVNCLKQQNQQLLISVRLLLKDIWVHVWKKSIGTVSLYLLDTDTDKNSEPDRRIAKALYQGSEEDVIAQQLILGIGGVKMLEALGIVPSLYHVNEGRPAFLYWQVLCQFIEKENCSYEEAMLATKAMIVYTNHTLVRAGNQTYAPDSIRKYAAYYAHKLHIPVDMLLTPGIDPTTSNFNITDFALRTSRKAAAVSKIHYELSKTVWPEFTWDYITNGVHIPSWQDTDIRNAGTNDQLWSIHCQKKKELMEFVRSQTGYTYDPNRLVIAWARRFAGYKRMDALFSDIARLKEIVSQTGREVQILISGRAHPDDYMAKAAMQKIIQYMQHEIPGYALYIPNYDLDVAHMLVKGTDVWINTPVKGMEASGTSGMKAAANGVLQCTVDDGWAAEVDWTGIGWTLDSDHIAESLYTHLEHNIIPEYYDHPYKEIPDRWLARMQKTIAISERFSTKRMLAEYKTKLYESGT